MIFTSLMSLPTRNKQDKCAKSNNDTVYLMLFLTISNSFFFFGIMLIFFLNSSFYNMEHFLYVFQCIKLLFANLKSRNLGVNLSWWHICKNSKLDSFFRVLKSSFSTLRKRLTESAPCHLRIICDTDLFAGNLSLSKNKNTSPKTLAIIFTGTCLTLKAALLRWK